MANERTLAVVVTANLTQMRAELQKADSMLQSTASAMKRMGNAYSGANTIAAANAAMAQVQRLGGVTSLTENEQHKLNAQLAEGVAKYQALGKVAPPQMVAMEEATRKANTELAKQPSMMDTINTKTVAMGAAIGSFFGGIALSAVNKLGAEIGVFAQKGMELAPLKASFQSLTIGIKQNGAEMLSGMQTASRGLVSEFDLMKSANKAMLLGLPVTAETMGTLTQAATTLGRAMGQDATKSVDDLITALGRSSPMILDNLGLTVKVGEANEAYAAKLGKTAEQLTDAEKKTAFYEAAMEAAKRKTAELGNQTETLGEILQRVWTSFGNIVTTVVSEFNTGLGAALSNMKNFGMFLEIAMNTSFANAVQVMANIERMKSASAAASTQMATDFAKVQAQQVIALVASGKSITAVAALYGLTEERVKALVAESKTLTAEQIAAAKAAADLQAKFQAKVDGWTGKALQKEVNDLATELRAAAKAGGISAAQMEDLGKKLAEMRKNGADLPAFMDVIANGFEDTHRKGLPLVTTLQSIAAAMKAVKSQSLGTGAPTLPITGILDSIKAVSSAVPKIMIGDMPKIVEPIKSALGQAFSGLGQTILGAIQGGGNIGKSIGASLLGGLGEDLGAKLAAKIGGSLGKALGSFAGPLGALLGSQLGGIFDKVFGEGAGRKDVKGFAESMGGFDALRAKLAELGDEGERLWINLTQKVGKGNTAQAAAAIKAIEDAFIKAGEAADVAKRKAEEAFAASPEGLASGFPTKAQLDKAAKDAEAAYVYMKNSGLYTAATLEQAWEKWQDALIESGNEGTKALRDINAEMKTLQEAIAEELPEYDADGVRIYGVIEQQNIDRLAKLEKEKAEIILKGIEEKISAEEEAAKTVEKATADAYARAVKDGADLDNYLRDLFSKGYTVPINFSGGGVPNGTFGGAMAEGGSGVVTKPTWFLAGEAGPERYNFTPMGQGASGGGGGDQTIVVQLGDDVILRNVVRGMPRYLKLIGAQ
jgi:plasmid maintenance system antidote protein VapI